MIRSLFLLNKALCINEFQGLLFNCEGAGNTACITTGAQALESLSFEGHTVSYPVFGMGVLSIGFLIVAFLILNSSQLTFLSLGHVGSGYANALNAPTTSMKEVSAKLMPDVAQEKDKITMAAKQWDIEKNSSDSKSSVEHGNLSSSKNFFDIEEKRDLTAPVQASM